MRFHKPESHGMMRTLLSRGMESEAEATISCAMRNKRKRRIQYHNKKYLQAFHAGFDGGDI